MRGSESGGWLREGVYDVRDRTHHNLSAPPFRVPSPHCAKFPASQWAPPNLTIGLSPVNTLFRLPANCVAVVRRPARRPKRHRTAAIPNTARNRLAQRPVITAPAQSSLPHGCAPHVAARRAAGPVALRALPTRHSTTLVRTVAATCHAERAIMNRNLWQFARAKHLESVVTGSFPILHETALPDALS